MKSLKYIVVVGVLVAFASCKKEEIRPNLPATSGIETYESSVNGAKLRVAGSSDNTEVILKDKIITGTSISVPSLDGVPGSNDTGIDVVLGSEGTGTITDPNTDPDASKRKGKK